MTNKKNTNGRNIARKEASLTNFDKLKREFEEQAILFNEGKIDKDNPELTKALEDLSIAVAFSVLNKVIEKSGNKVMLQIKNDLWQDLRNNQALTFAVNNSTELSYNKNGDLVQIVIDKDLYSAISTIIEKGISDSYDLTLTATMSLLEWTRDKFPFDKMQANFLDLPFEVKRLKTKIVINDGIPQFEYQSTTIIQEIYRAVRRSIQDNQAVKSASEKFVYIDSITTDSGQEYTVYKRLPKNSDLASYARDINGKRTTATASITDIESFEKYIEKLSTKANFTQRQVLILWYRYNGYGQRAIATRLKISPQAVQCIQKAILEKLDKIGLNSQAILEILKEDR